MRVLIFAAAAALALSACAGRPAGLDAAAIGAAVADTHRPPEDVKRDVDRKPAEMLAFIGIKRGDRVVDLVPGRGYFTKLFAAAVGPEGRVYAYAPAEFDALFKKFNVPIPSGTDPNFPNIVNLHQRAQIFTAPEPVDIVWTSQNYHDLHDSFAGPVDLKVMNKAIYQALKPGGLFIVLDHAAEPGSGLRDTETLHRIDPAAVKAEVLAAGFVFVGESQVLRNSTDPHTANVFDKSIRGHTDQFVYKFRKPK